MGGEVLVAPSILSADFSMLGEEVRKAGRAGADWLHVDVMDGVFVPNITIGPLVVSAIRPLTDLFFDVHLMIERPERYVEQFAAAGSDLITFHVEACDDPSRVIDIIRGRGAKAGISIRPGTGTDKIEPFLGQVDLVLFMTVEPGFGGQAFMSEVLDKIRPLRRRYDGLIQVDGGINAETAPLAIEAGVDVLVAGTAVFGADDYGAAIRSLKG